MNGRQISVIALALAAALLMLLYAPEKTTQINTHRDIFYRFSWMPAYFSGDMTQWWEIWSDRVFWPYLAAEILALTGLAAGALRALRSPGRRRRRSPGR